MHQENSTRLLVESNSHGEAEKRAKEMLGRFSPQIEINPAKPKILVLRGSISLERLGLSESLFDRLASEVTHVIHSAATIEFSLLLDCTLNESFCNHHDQLDSEKKSFLQVKYLCLSKFLLILGGFVFKLKFG